MGTTTKKKVWVKETPLEEGLYWIKYKKGGNRGICVTVADVTRVKQEVLVKTFRNDEFFEGPGHGGPGLKWVDRYSGKVKYDRSIRFGPKLEPPE